MGGKETKQTQTQTNTCLSKKPWKHVIRNPWGEPKGREERKFLGESEEKVASWKMWEFEVHASGESATSIRLRDPRRAPGEKVKWGRGLSGRPLPMR